VGQTAVVRGRLMELLALEACPGRSRPGLRGGHLLAAGCDAVHAHGIGPRLLTVPDAVAAALLRREGVLGDLLTLAEACESSDDAVFHKAAGTLHLSSQQINMAHLQALAWADQMTE
jgi:EAL and modified HD-GYP domain-containing signal transduction protein